jgi:hypothetical protein
LVTAVEREGFVNFCIDKKTGTYAETLEAIGLAGALREVGFTGVTITDDGARFRIHSPIDLPPERWDTCVTAGFPYIWKRSKEAQKPELPRVIDYEAGKVNRDAARKAGKKSKGKLQAQDVEGLPEVEPEIDNAAMLESMRKGWDSDRYLAKWVAAHPQDAANWIRFRVGRGGALPAEPPKMSNTQILNPISGKGVSAGKTEMRSAGSIPDSLIDPFSEWMKLRGLWDAMLLCRSDDDFKFFVIEPADISADGIGYIRAELAKLGLWRGVRLDISAALECAKLLILHSDVAQDASPWCRVRGRTPRAVIAGLRQAYFKSLGTAAALMNDALLPLPDWFAIRDKDDVDAYLGIIEEAIGKGGCLKSLQDKNSDDGHLLQQYREWLLTGQLSDLLDFHHSFALHLVQRLSRHDWARPFGTENLYRLLTRTYEEEFHVTEIIEDHGFQSVARALRNATIYALTLPNSRREVRFGIAQKWKQKMKAGDEELATVIAEFVQDYNWETAHKLKGKGHAVTTEELGSLLRLLRGRAELVGSLLLAYGYARAPKVETALAEEAASQA